LVGFRLKKARFILKFGFPLNLLILSVGRAVELEWRLESADDLKGILELIVAEVMGADDLDIGVKGRVVASLLTVGVRLLEVGSIEERLEKLEARILPGIRT
jgi:hypothetical protein